MDLRAPAYLEALRDAIGGALGSRGGLWLTGSVALDDDRAARSDLDIIVSVTVPPEEGEVRALIERLRHESLPCPYRGLDLSLFAAGIVASPPRVPSYILAITTGRRWPLDVSRGGRDAGSILDLAFCRRHGRALAGKQPHEAIGEMPREWIEEEARAAIEWHRGVVHDDFHDPLGDQAVLNACRAWMVHSEGVLSSKTAAGEWARRKASGRTIISEALEARGGLRTAPLDRAEVIDYLDWTLQQLDENEV